MCGLVALYNFDQRPVDPAVLAGMTDAQRHRGPDDQGFVRFTLRERSLVPSLASSAGPALDGGLGFNRLAIRDLSAAGHQPMTTEDRRIVLVFNGEIYNADEERIPLERRGIRFRGSSDTEVLLHMYREYGMAETLARLNGMFGLVVVDLDAQTLSVARDQLGVKPLYVWRGRATLAIASEAKSFLAHPDFKAELAQQHLAEHLVFRACADDRHLLRGVEQVRPGEWLEVKADGSTSRRRYWRPATHTSWRGGYREATDAVEAAIELGVRRQLASDVPVGCQFSGGVDSSLVSAFANRHQEKGKYQTFSVVVKDASFSEERWIDAGEKLLAVEGHRFAFGAEEFASRLERATWHLDEPLDHMNSIGIMLLAEESRRHVTVLLSGEGADEAFCGYSRFHRALLRPALGPLAALAGPVPMLGAKLASFAPERGADVRDWFIRASSPLLPEHLVALTGKDLLEEAMDSRRAMFPAEGEFIARCRAYELETYLVGLLKRQDKMTMAHSLENRVPLLDRDLVELVTTMPASFFVDRRPHRGSERNTKRVLKAVTARHFPSSYVYRKKEGFGLPLANYFRAPAMRDVVEDVLRTAGQRAVLDARTMRRWWSTDLDRPFVAEALWIAVTFELWARQFLDRSARATP